MNDNDIEYTIFRIITGQTYFEYNTEEYLLKHPSVDIKHKAAVLYNNILNEEKYENWIREENSERIMISLGIWDNNTNEIIKRLYSRLDDIKVDLYKSWMMPSQQKSIRKNLDHIKKELNKILVIKYNFFNHTLEGYATSIKSEYLICQTLYKNNNLVFDFNNRSDPKSYAQFNNLSQEIDKLGIQLHNMKIVARSPQWKSYWGARKYNNLFDNTIVNWTDDQRMIYKLSQMYDNIYEHPECPEEIVINDDDMLDGWMIMQQREQNRNKKQKGVESRNKGLQNASEVFLFPQNDEEFKDIIGLNSVEGKMTIQEKMRFIEQRGEAEEYELPDVQRNIRNEINELNKRMKQK